MVEIEVLSRAPGVSGDSPSSVLVAFENERITVRELIRRTVEEQVRESRADPARGRRALDRRYLSDDEIRARAATGAVRYNALLDPAAEVERAWRAFGRGGFAVFAGGRQVTGLDEEVVVRLGERVTFLRLVALVGG